MYDWAFSREKISLTSTCIDQSNWTVWYPNDINLLLNISLSQTPASSRKREWKWLPQLFIVNQACTARLRYELFYIVPFWCYKQGTFLQLGRTQVARNWNLFLMIVRSLGTLYLFNNSFAHWFLFTEQLGNPMQNTNKRLVLIFL